MSKAKTKIKRKIKRGGYGGYWLDQVHNSPFWYRVRYFPEARSYEKVSLEETDFDAAQQKLIAFVDAQRVRADDPNSKDPTIVKLYPVLDWYYETHGKTVTQSKMQAIAIRYWKEHFDAQTTVAGVTPDKVDEMAKTLLEDGKSLGYISRIFGVCRAALRRAVDHLKISSAPKIKDPMTQEDREAVDPMGRPLSIGELARLFVHAGSDHLDVWMNIALHTMCRPAAALDLTKAQVNFEDGIIDLNPKGRKRNKKRRAIVRLTPGLRALLLEVERMAVKEAEDDGRTDFQFTHYVCWRGERIHSISNAFTRAVERAGLDGTHVTLYSIRHTMGRELRSHRVASEEISVLLGHKPQNVSQATSFYAPLDPDYLAHATEVVEAYAQRLGAEIAKAHAEAEEAQNDAQRAAAE